MSPLLHLETPGRIIFGRGALAELKGQIHRIGSTRVLLVTDPGLVKSGACAQVEALLADGGPHPAIYADVEPDPSLETAYACARAARDHAADAVVGLGGGSAIDIAKIAALLAGGNADLLEYVGVGRVPAAGLPVIAIPTTAGTGSEVTPIAVLSDKTSQLKKGIVSEYLVPKVALIDPMLACTLPPRVTAYTGMDALTHCIEAYTNRNAIPFIDGLALEGIRLIGRSLRTAVHQGTNLDARESMALGSLYGGLCLGPVNTAAVHAMAYPLGGMYNVPHGLANTVLLPHVIAFNLPACLERYSAVADCLGEPRTGSSDAERAARAVAAILRLAHDIGIDVRMRNLGVRESTIPEMAAAAVQVTRLMNNNPRTVGVEDARAIYAAAY